MMTFLRRLLNLFFLCLFLLPLTSTAQTSADTKTDTIDHIFDQLPIKEQLNEVPREMHSQFSQNPFGLSSSQNKQMMKLFMKAFATDTLLAVARNTFENNYSAEYGNTTVEWLNSEEGRKLSETEREYYTLQGIRKRVVHNYELEQEPASQKRTDLINALIQESSYVESEVESQVIMFRAFVNAFDELSNQRSFDSTQVEGFVSNFRSRARSQLSQEATDQLLVKYHGLENELLKEKISFYETEAGNWLSSTRAQARHSAYRSAADRFLELIREL